MSEDDPPTAESQPEASVANESRRSILKVTGAAASTGALGALAGCTGSGGGGGGDEENGGTDTPADEVREEGSQAFFGTETETGTGADGDGTKEADGGGGGETVQISYLSAEAVENSQTKPWYQKSIGRFEEEMGDVEVQLQTASYGDIKSKLASSVEGGNPPTLAEGGSAGLQFYFSGKVPSHTPFVEESDVFPQKWSAANTATAKFRGDFWSGGAHRHSLTSSPP